MCLINDAKVYIKILFFKTNTPISRFAIRIIGIVYTDLKMAVFKTIYFY
jgi:hypothetical protein